MEWRLGTMGFGYAEWNGVFYPRGLRSGENLAYYARHFDAVELDTTFHAVPPPERIARWAEATPDNFRFSVKTPRAVTHDAPIDKGVPTMLSFLDGLAPFGEKLGVVLLQFSPAFTSLEHDRLDRFLSELPGDVSLAVEFRHSSWENARTETMLRRHNCCWVAGDYLGALTPPVVTSDFLYVRWVGQHDKFPEKNKVMLDVTDRLDWWRREIQRRADVAQRVWGFFNNDYSGYSIATCNHFKATLGLPVVEPAPDEPFQREQTLFG